MISYSRLSVNMRVLIMTLLVLTSARGQQQASAVALAARHVRRVGAMLEEPARAKFRTAAAGVAVIEREFVVTFNQDSPPDAVTAAARQLQEGDGKVKLKYVGNYQHGWKGLVLKVPEQPPREMARLLQGLLLLPDVMVGEPNAVITVARGIRMAGAPQSHSMPAQAPSTALPPAPGAPADAPSNSSKRPRWPQLAGAFGSPSAQPVTQPATGGSAADNADTCSHLTSYLSAKVVRVPAPNWGLDRVDTRENRPSKEYAFASAGSRANVFIIDSGVQVDHKELRGRAFAAGAGGFDAFGGDGTDSLGHGTHCAGIAAGATTGVAQNATIFSVRVLDSMGQGTIASLISGINFVATSNLPRRVASVSLAGSLTEAVNHAVEAAVRAGVLVVVAAGNDGMNACETSPASAPSAVTVGAVDALDARASFSNFGGCVDIFAPGVKINSSTTGSGSAYNVLSGTSMAAPHVAGVAARLWSRGVCNSNVECAEAIRCLATPGLVTGLGSSSPNLLLHISSGL